MCLTPRTYVDNLNRIESFKPYDIDHDFCDYVDVGESISISSSDLGIMQLNIRGLYSKIDKYYNRYLMNVHWENKSM